MKSTSNTVYDELRHRLTSGRDPQDASLVPLAQSEEFAASRTPVREALALLERDGLLVGTRVVSPYGNAPTRSCPTSSNCAPRSTPCSPPRRHCGAVRSTWPDWTPPSRPCCTPSTPR
ncbi:GntR family transcriptional regulator [Streptomyces sp. NPDC046727]|uniref:GntR family transcriptional regulator n=1 Tax=Streptomyces sp. NPDC046727 TaxID=3155373 RepID=UPI0033E07AC3